MKHRLNREIRTERHQRNIDEYTAGIQIPLIRYNLELIGTIEALISLLDKKIDYLHDGRNKLAHFNRQIQDDVQILNTVGTMNTDTLMDRIDLTLEAYAAATGNRLIDAGNLPVEDRQVIWDRCP